MGAILDLVQQPVTGAGKATTVIPPVIGAGVAYSVAHHSSSYVTTDNAAWVTVAGAAAALALWRIVATPFELWIRERQRADTAEKAIDVVRSKIIADIRKLVASFPNDGTDPRQYLQSSPEFLQFKRYLSSSYFAGWQTSDASISLFGNTVVRTEIDMLSKEVDRIEHEWGLLLSR